MFDVIEFMFDEVVFESMPKYQKSGTDIGCYVVIAIKDNDSIVFTCLWISVSLSIDYDMQYHIIVGLRVMGMYLQLSYFRSNEILLTF